MAEHRYELFVRWTGSRSTGTTGYRDYDRTHEVSAAGKPTIAGSSDPAFRGEAERWNPEELLVASLSQCHLLWYLHLATNAQVVVTSYVDAASGTVQLNADGGGQFREIVLRPHVVVAEETMMERALTLHD